MLLRRVSKHVKDQNWFAVFIDFLIVVLGILIAFQITEWNEGQQTNKREKSILLQLEEEFTVIKSAIEKQNSLRSEYVENLSELIGILQSDEAVADELKIKKGLESARATGRRPAQSAAYLQLMASGELTMLSSEDLQQSLVNYETLLQRDAFMFPELTNSVTEEISTNRFVDYNIQAIKIVGAGVDTNNSDNSTSELIRLYDLKGLKTFENRYELMYVLHITILSSDENLLTLVKQILNQINSGKNL
jgi:hypothetical protein